MVPAAFSSVLPAPITPNGKVDRAAARPRGGCRHRDAPVAPATRPRRGSRGCGADLGSRLRSARRTTSSTSAATPARRQRACSRRSTRRSMRRSMLTFFQPHRATRGGAPRPRRHAAWAQVRDHCARAAASRSSSSTPACSDVQPRGSASRTTSRSLRVTSGTSCSRAPRGLELGKLQPSLGQLARTPPIAGRRQPRKKIMLASYSYGGPLAWRWRHRCCLPIRRGRLPVRLRHHPCRIGAG